MVGVINYDAGNASSVINALTSMGYKAQLIDQLNHLEKCSMIILPGVGTAGATKKSLIKIGLWEALSELVLQKKIPFVGICVGLQILFEFSEEDNTTCLGWLKGQVKRYDSSKVRVPQMGWNTLNYNSQHPLYEKLNVIEKNPPYFYFVNSYYAIPSDTGVILGECEYETKFAAMVNQENIFATQFHLEKSGEAGLLLFKKILTICNQSDQNRKF